MDSQTGQTDERFGEDDIERQSRQQETAEREMPCPVCGAPMPNLRGGKDSICPVCGFKDSCCY